MNDKQRAVADQYRLAGFCIVPSGEPDFLAVRREGETVAESAAVWVLPDPGSLTPNQQHFHDVLERLGVPVRVVKAPSSLEHFTHVQLCDFSLRRVAEVCDSVRLKLGEEVSPDSVVYNAIFRVAALIGTDAFDFAGLRDMTPCVTIGEARLTHRTAKDLDKTRAAVSRAHGVSFEKISRDALVHFALARNAAELSGPPQTVSR